jgi:CheY-like chemotaxis protein
MMSRILWADDEPWFIEPLCYALSRAGHQVDTVDTVGAALECLRALEQTPYDLIIFDIAQTRESLEEQAGMDAAQLLQAAERARWGGIDIYRTARELAPGLPLLIYTVVPEADIRKHAPDIELEGMYLRKGGQRQDFFGMVDRILNR